MTTSLMKSKSQRDVDEAVSRDATERLLANPPKLEIKPGSMIGLMSEHHLCIDCGFDTAPGCQGRIETELAFMDGMDSVMTISDQSESYMVKDKVWKAAGMEPWGGCLCIGCLEKRIGRRLRPKDFDRNHPFNDPRLPCSERLRQRREGFYENS
jgi:hypothetical protein